MPSPQQLPQSLAKLVRRNALSVGYESFRADVDRLGDAINRLLAPPSSDALSTMVELTELQAVDCESAGSLRSTSGTTESQIEITNQSSSRTVEIFSGSITMGMPCPMAPCNHRSVRSSSRT